MLKTGVKYPIVIQMIGGSAIQSVAAILSAAITPSMIVPAPSIAKVKTAAPSPRFRYRTIGV